MSEFIGLDVSLKETAVSIYGAQANGCGGESARQTLRC